MELLERGYTGKEEDFKGEKGIRGLEYLKGERRERMQEGKRGEGEGLKVDHEEPGQI